MTKRNPNGAGTVTRRKDGRYQAAVYVMQPDGTRARKYVYGKTWEECDQKRQELVSRDRQGIPTPTRSAKLAEWLPYWLEHFVTPQRKRTTVAKYETHIRLYLVPLLGTKGLETLSPRDVRTALARVTKQSSAATAKESHKILRSALTAACREELITRNVAGLVTPPRVVSREMHPWTLDETLAFLSAARPDPLYAAFVLAVALGMRRGRSVDFGGPGSTWTTASWWSVDSSSALAGCCTRTRRRAASAGRSRSRASAWWRFAGTGCGRPRCGRRRGRPGRRPATSSPPVRGSRWSRPTSTARSVGLLLRPGCG